MMQEMRNTELEAVNGGDDGYNFAYELGQKIASGIKALAESASQTKMDPPKYSKMGPHGWMRDK